MQEHKLSSSLRKQLADYFIGKYHDYEDMVVSGRRLASKFEIQMVNRQKTDLDSLTNWRFDFSKAVKPLVWFAANLRFPSGDRKGKPLKLSPWQIWITMVLFGWVNAKGNRRFIDAYIEVARKNGKSTWAAAILCYLCFSDAEANGNPCYIAATSLDQAAECFDRARNMLMDLPVKVQDSKNNKVLTVADQKLMAISGEPKDGKLPHGAIIDEYHQHRSNELIDSIVTGNVSDPNVLVMRITTAGTNLQSVCKQEHDKGIKVLEGSVQMDRYFFAIFSLDDGDNVDVPYLWEKANPNYGVSVDEDLLVNRYDYAKLSAADMISFKTKNLNMWANSLKRWANMDKWNDLCNVPFDADMLLGRTCFGGLDLSHNSDFTAFVLDFPDPETKMHKQLYWLFIPGDREVELERQLYVPLRQWVHDGYVISCPGPVIDYGIVAQTIIEAREAYDLKMIAADRWHLGYLDQHLPDWFSELAIEFSQGWKQMSASTSSFERSYLQGNIQANGNPVMRWMMSCCESKADVSGNIRLVKPNVQKSQARIDSVIASIMAYDTAETQTGEGLEGSPSDLLIVF